jgi:hypothetical protein
MSPYMYHANPFGGLFLMIVVLIVQLLIAFLIYRDAKEQKMLAPVWAILAILPMFGIFADVLYLVIREFRVQRMTAAPEL